MSAVHADVAAWSAALDDIESGLVADAATPAIWEVPTRLGPLPAELVPRAQRLVTSVDAVHAELAASAAVILEELDGLAAAAASPVSGGRRRLHAPDEPPAPRLVDHDA